MIKVLKFFLDMKTVKWIGIAVYVMLGFLLLNGVNRFSLWWAKCLIEMRCFERDFVTQSLPEMFDYSINFFTNLFSDIISSIILISATLYLLYWYGWRFRLIEEIYEEKKLKTKTVLGRVFSDSPLTIYLILFTVFVFSWTAYKSYKTNEWRSNIAQEEMSYLEGKGSISHYEKRMKDRLSKRERYIKVRKSEFEKLLFFEDKYKEKSYDKEKYLSVNVQGIVIEKPISDLEKLNYFLSELNRKKQLFDFSISYEDLNQDNILRLKNDLKLYKEKVKKFNTEVTSGLEKFIDTLREEQSQYIVSKYNGQDFIYIVGKYKQGYIYSPLKRLRIRVQDSDVVFPAYKSSYLLKVENYIQNVKIVDIKAKPIANWTMKDHL